MRPQTDPGDESAATDEAARLVLPAAYLDLDALGLRLVPPRGKRGKAGAVAEVVQALLGLTPIHDPEHNDWPTNNAVAAHVGVSTAAVSQSMQRGRAHWSASPELLSVAGDLQILLADLGGIASVNELAGSLLEIRGSGASSGDAERLSNAVLRAVIECSGSQELPFVTRRFGPRTLVSLAGMVTIGGTQASFDSDALLSLTTDLGRRADQLVAANPLVASSDAVAALRAIRGATAAALADGRLVRLAASASATAVANAAADLVPRAPSPVEALRWSRPSLVGSDAQTEATIVDRVRVRFPTAILPSRPELDALIQAADLPLLWSSDTTTYVPTGTAPGALTTFTRVASRHETIVQTAPAPITTSRQTAQISPAAQAALDLEAHLQRSLRDGGFLALRVPPDSLRRARAELARFQGPPHDLVPIDLERAFLTHLRAQAGRLGVSWSKLVEADAAGPGSGDWTRLTAVTAPAVDATVADVLASGPGVIAWYPGVLVRHQGVSGLGAIDRLRDAVTSHSGALRTLWLVMVGSAVEAKPMIDGVAVPIIGPNEWADITTDWLKNLHRSEGNVA